MNSALKNLLVGIFVLSSIALLVVVVMFLKPRVGDGKQTLFVRFSDINKINIGTRVLFAGRPVGEVVTIEEIKDARKEPTDELGRVYFYEVKLKIDSEVKVFNTDEISLQTSGLLGEKSIAIIPKAAPIGVTPKQIALQPVYANSVDPLENALVEFSELSSHMEDAFREVGGWIKTNGPTVAQTINSFGQTMHSINEQEVVGTVNGLLKQAQTAMAQLDEKKTFTNIGDTVDSIKNAAHCLTDSNSTIGKLLNNDDLYLSTNAILSKVNTLMNDLNQYGLMFNLNKRWQRTRIKRADQLNALDTPVQFKTYFENEIDGINTSIQRLSMVVERANNSADREAILASKQFTQDFAELLRQAEALSDSLKLYNQQLIDARGK